MINSVGHANSHENILPDNQRVNAVSKAENNIINDVVTINTSCIMDAEAEDAYNSVIACLNERGSNVEDLYHGQTIDRVMSLISL